MFKRGLIFLTIACGYPVYATELHTPFTVELLAINGKKVDTAQHDYPLRDGNNQIVLKYVKSLRNGNKNSKFETKPLVANIQVTSDNQDFYIKHNQFNTYTQAVSAYENNTFGWTLSSNGKRVPLTTEVLPSNTGFMPYHDIERVIKDYNKKNHVQIVHNDVTPTNNNFIAEFKSWFLDASPEEKKAMLKWMIDNSDN